jgi:ATP-dependent DNA ligase
VSDFDRLHSRRHDGAVQLLGFDLFELDGIDLRREPLENCKATLESLLRRSREGIQLVEHIEAADGATVFAHACSSASKASCRSGGTRPTSTAAAGRGSR